MVEREHDLVEHDVVAAAGAQPQMIPGLNDARARQSGGHQKQPDAHLRLIGPGPQRIPFQNRRAGRIDLATAEPPSGLGSARDSRGQAATRGRAEVGFDPQGVDQRHAFNRFARQLARQAARPVRAPRHHQMLNVMHRQHQGGRWIRLAQDAKHAGSLECAGAGTSQRGRHGQRQQFGFRQPIEVLERKTRVAVMPRGPRGKFRSEQVRPVENRWRCFGWKLSACGTAGGPHHVASNPSNPRM